MFFESICSEIPDQDLSLQLIRCRPNSAVQTFGFMELRVAKAGSCGFT